VTGRPLVDATRAMFASNFPIDRLGVDYDTIVATFADAIADRPPAEQDALRHDNARRIYRISA